MAKLVYIVAVVDDDWSRQDLLHEANDALVKYNVVQYVQDIQVIQENYDDGRGDSEEA